MSKTIGYIGLGKMGINMTGRLIGLGWKIYAYDPEPAVRMVAKEKGAVVFSSIKTLAEALPDPKVVFMMVPHKVVDEVIRELLPYLSKGSSVIDGGNSHFENSVKRYKSLKWHGVAFLDAGISGGPKGALNGACVMVGGDKRVFMENEQLFSDIAMPTGYLYVGKSGAGHFAKMVHNGIEYGVMQSIAEGFSILKNSHFKYDLEKLARLYNTGSVIESRLVGWLSDAYQIYGKNLKKVSGKVAHTGEGDWTFKVAQKMKIAVPAIKTALQFRKKSAINPNGYTGKILSALRNQFGGHNIK